MPEEYAKSRSELEERILKGAPRLRLTDSFKFACHPKVSCFGDCCGDVNILLTPRDVLRLKHRLGLSSGEFLALHTILPQGEAVKLPAPLLKMRENAKKSCCFLGENGCSVYPDRPWACRMYPLGFAAPADPARSNEAFFFLLEEQGCAGFAEACTQTVAQWLHDQGVDRPDELDAFMQEVAAGGHLQRWRNEEPRKLHMFFMATYDIDTFRRFIFDSSFLMRFELPEDEVERLRDDDEELLRFSVKWLEFSLLGRPALTMRAKP
ncbi:MAG: YkgJ family cysteine cluster protein [Planctomycetota bacterium]